MPMRSDIKKVLVLGAGPIVIGQACEFDYSGTQGCRALKSLGLEVILLNSNPATIMTDPEFADRTYVEPLLPEIAERIIAKERPDSLLPTLGGQTALNLAVALAKTGVLEKYGVKLIGASLEAIEHSAIPLFPDVYEYSTYFNAVNWPQDLRIDAQLDNIVEVTSRIISTARTDAATRLHSTLRDFIRGYAAYENTTAEVLSIFKGKE